MSKNIPSIYKEVGLHGSCVTARPKKIREKREVKIKYTGKPMEGFKKLKYNPWDKS